MPSSDSRSTSPHSPSEVLGLVLGRTPYGESDLIVTLFTDHFGKVSALARGARKSQKRFGGSLEPLHTLCIELTERSRGELSTLRGAMIHQPRTDLLSRLSALSAAGKALSWVRRAAPSRTPEPVLWQEISYCLDELGRAERSPETVLCAFGLRLLQTLGWGLSLTGCVVCGRPCPTGRAAWVNPERGGLVCRACGGGPFKLSGEDRQHLAQVAQGAEPRLLEEVTELAEKIVERALGAHLGFEDPGAPQRLG